MQRAIRVSVMEERRLFREALSRRLALEAGMKLAAATDQLRTLVDVVREHSVDVVLIDASSGDSRIVDIIWEIKSCLPEVRVVVLGAGTHKNLLLRCVEAGACGYTMPSTSFAGLVRTIREVHAGRTVCSPDILLQVFSRIQQLAREKVEQEIPPECGLSVREVELVKLIAAGLQNKEIAQQLGIKLTTVKNYVHNILQKLEVARRGEITQRAYELGVLRASLRSGS